MRISDWSSDVCSSDLVLLCAEGFRSRSERASGERVQPRADAGAERMVPGAQSRRQHPQPLFRRRRHASGRGDTGGGGEREGERGADAGGTSVMTWDRSEEHTSELQSLMRSSYAVFCLKKKKRNKTHSNTTHEQNKN